MNNSFSVTSSPSFVLPKSSTSQRADKPLSGQRLPDYLLNPKEDIVSGLFDDLSRTNTGHQVQQSKHAASKNPFGMPVSSSASWQLEASKPLRLPDYLLNPEEDIASKLFDDLLRSTETGYQGKWDYYDTAAAKWPRRIIQRGVAGTKAEEQVMGWMRNGVEMAQKAIAMVKENHPQASRLLNKYFGNASFGTSSKFLDYAEKAIATMEKHIEQRGAQVVVYSGDYYGAFVYPEDHHRRIFINQRGFNARPDDSWMARLMVHENTHFAGAGDWGYINQVGVNGPRHKLHNADSLAYAIKELADHYVGNIKPKPKPEPESKPEPKPKPEPESKPDMPVQPVNLSIKPWQPDQTYWTKDIVMHDGERYESTGINRNMPPNNPRWQHAWKLLESKPVDVDVIESTKPMPKPPVLPQVHFQVWHNPLGGQRNVEVWNEIKAKQGGYKNGDLVLYRGRAYHNWLAPDGNMKWVEAYNPKKRYSPNDIASFRGVVKQVRMGYWVPV